MRVKKIISLGAAYLRLVIYADAPTESTMGVRARAREDCPSAASRFDVQPGPAFV